MVTNSKVLTVSYGTFSCTLEGFDDSFDTMKSIAEYFRDLAADDRYFGAEPPTPDAEMLARIAEREIERRVHARMDHGAIVLSAAQDEAGEVAPPAPEPTVTDESIAVEDTAVQDIPEQQDEAIVAEDVSDAPDAEAEPEIEDVTDDILEIVTAPDAEEATPEAEEAIAEDAPAKDDTLLEGTLEEQEFAVEAEAPEVQEISAEDIAPEVDAEVEEVESDIAAEQVFQDVVGETEFDLSRISAALEETREEDAIEEVAETPAALEDAPEVEPEIENVAAFMEPVEEALEVEAETAEDILAPAAENDQFDENSIAAKLRRIRSVVSRVEALPEDDDFSEDEHAVNVMADTEDDAEADDVLTLEQPIIQEPPVQEQAEPKPVRARILRMKKADYEQAKENGQILEAESYDDDAEVAPEAPAPVEPAPVETARTSLTPEDEAELLAELAAVEAELKQGDLEEVASAELEFTEDDYAPAAEEIDRNTRGQHLTSAAPTTEEGVSRLLEETNQQFEEPEGSRRRNAIAHLRAAVAATKAESGLEKSDDDDSEVYRKDLASVVQPLQHAPKPVATPSRPQPSAKAVAAREAAPLKLVAEQRIDAPKPAKTSDVQRDPVRPRRVSAADRTERPAPLAAPVSHGSDEVGSFDDFVEATGARSLPEIMEAAAAYLTFVEGHPRFSRPMVMRLARDHDEDNFSREDGLRGFGQLLRDNKIEKLEGGRFTASDLIRYKPEDRAAG